MRSRAVALLAATAILLGTGLAAAQDESSRPASDIVDLVPTTLGGIDADVEVVRGADHFISELA